MNAFAADPLSQAHRFGKQTLAPVFAAFAYLLLLQTRERDIRHLAFVARDGLFLRQVTETLIHALAWPDAPRLGDVHLSRLSTNLAGWKAGEALGESAYAEAREVRGGEFTLDAFLRYYGLDSTAASLAILPGLQGDTPLANYAQVAPLLQSPAFLQSFQAARQQQLGLLKRYLSEQGLFSAPESALVDIGWRGTIPAALDRAFNQDSDYHPLPCFYLGYWHELGCLPQAEGRISGLLADYRKGRHIKEGAAYYLSLLLEAVCRPNQGPTRGYALEAHGVAPLTAHHAPSEIEITSQAQSGAIRKGILVGVAALGQDWGNALPDPEALRRQAQGQLHQLAFYPPGEAIALAQTLCHTEGHYSNWATPLLPSPIPPRPWLRPKAWLAGLSAPWRSGYIAASSGPVLARLLYGLEATLLILPTEVRHGLRKLALTLAGKKT